MKSTYSISVMAGVEELEREAFSNMFGLAKARATELFEARIPDGATSAVVRDDVGRTVFRFPKGDLPAARLR